MDQCASCEVFTALDRVALVYSREVFETLAPWVAVTFSVFVGIWFAWQCVMLVIGDADLKGVFKTMALFVFIAAVLQFSDFYFDWFYFPARELMSGLTQMVVSAPSTGVAETELVSLVERVELEIFAVIHFTWSVWQRAGIFDLPVMANMIILMLPYILVWFIFLAFLLEGTFKLLAVTVVGPVLIAAAGFKPTRGFTMAGLRMAVNGILTVVFAGVAMGFTIMVLNMAVEKLPLDNQGNYAGRAWDFMFSEAYFQILIIGLLSVLFHLKAATIASNISGALDGPGAAAAVAGMGAGIAGAVLGKVTGAASGVGRAAGEAKLQNQMKDASSVKAQILRRYLARR